MMRLDKFLADAGVGTRSEIKKLVRGGKIVVNNETARKPEQKVEPQTDRIFAEGKEISYEKFIYYLFHKPAGCVTAKQDKKDKTVMDFFPEDLKKKLAPVGRLDKDTEGLLLLTNDGSLTHRLLSPAYHVEKTYFAKLDTAVPEKAAELFSQGVDIGDEKLTLPAKLHILSENEAELTISEGRFHQVKRMFHAVGCNVIYLKRLSMGNLKLGDLKKGEYRKLTAEELLVLQESAEHKGEE